GDLRTLITALRMSGDLERMGDLAVHIAKTARRRHPESAVPPGEAGELSANENTLTRAVGERWSERRLRSVVWRSRLSRA
ncbi:PhoU domain-containing protein, partial [Actinomadura darangshiensis]|uniref:PhoU domain-containing protein n=1 Tax=Actinomadura darangshiensis TaxID=705336 RepID=UPI0024436864